MSSRVNSPATTGITTTTRPPQAVSVVCASDSLLMVVPRACGSMYVTTSARSRRSGSRPSGVMQTTTPPRTGRSPTVSRRRTTSSATSRCHRVHPIPSHLSLITSPSTEETLPTNCPGTKVGWRLAMFPTSWSSALVLLTTRSGSSTMLLFPRLPLLGIVLPPMRSRLSVLIWSTGLVWTRSRARSSTPCMTSTGCRMTSVASPLSVTQLSVASLVTSPLSVATMTGSPSALAGLLVSRSATSVPPNSRLSAFPTLSALATATSTTSVSTAQATVRKSSILRALSLRLLA
mmetsp:Transcript_48260/g.121473  ORF Transcript_48260/g.121473 Transcript_48260/m.121473 type:complete len:290 (-) Transcript_48260:550-1419(-)